MLVPLHLILLFCFAHAKIQFVFHALQMQVVMYDIFTSQTSWIFLAIHSEFSQSTFVTVHPTWSSSWLHSHLDFTWFWSAELHSDHQQSMSVPSGFMWSSDQKERRYCVLVVTTGTQTPLQLFLNPNNWAKTQFLAWWSCTNFQCKCLSEYVPLLKPSFWSISCFSPTFLIISLMHPSRYVLQV